MNKYYPFNKKRGCPFETASFYVAIPTPPTPTNHLLIPTNHPPTATKQRTASAKHLLISANHPKVPTKYPTTSAKWLATSANRPILAAKYLTISAKRLQASAKRQQYKNYYALAMKYHIQRTIPAHKCVLYLSSTHNYQFI
jgi:hypothetical protein